MCGVHSPPPPPRVHLSRQRRMPQFACTSLMQSSFIEKLSIQLSGMGFSSISTAQGVDECYAANGLVLRWVLQPTLQKLPRGHCVDMSSLCRGAANSFAKLLKPPSSPPHVHPCTRLQPCPHCLASAFTPHTSVVDPSPLGNQPNCRYCQQCTLSAPKTIPHSFSCTIVHPQNTVVLSYPATCMTQGSNSYIKTQHTS